MINLGIYESVMSFNFPESQAQIEYLTQNGNEDELQMTMEMLFKATDLLEVMRNENFELQHIDSSLKKINKLESKIAFLNDYLNAVAANFGGEPNGAAVSEGNECIARLSSHQKAAAIRHKENYDIKAYLKVWHSENRHRFLRLDGSLIQSRAATEAIKQAKISHRKAAEYMGIFEREYLSKK